MRAVHHGFTDSALAPRAHGRWRGLVDRGIGTVVAHWKRWIDAVHHPIEAELIIHHGIGRLLHVVRTLRKRGGRLVETLWRSAKVQLRWVDCASMTHQHVAEVRIKTTIDGGSPQATGKVHWQPRRFQFG